MASEIPNGSIQAISSAATTTLAIGIAFLGYWGFGPSSGKVGWSANHLLVLIPGAVSFALLAYVPLAVTRLENEVGALVAARRTYALGACLLLAAVFLSFGI